MAKAKKFDSIPLVIAIAIILFLYLIRSFDFIESIELSTYDYRMSKIRGPVTADSNIVVIAIDDQAYKALKRKYPWPRSWHAKLVENLKEAGAKVVAFDIHFDQPSEIERQMDDTLFAQEIEMASNVILVSKNDETIGSNQMISNVPPLDILADASYNIGNAGINPDFDGIHRKYLFGVYKIDPLNHDTVLEPTLAIQIFKYVRNIPPDEKLRYDASQNVFYIKNYKFPVLERSREGEPTFLINYVGGKNTFQYYSFADVVDDEEFDLVEEFDLNAFDDPGDVESGIPAGLLYSGKLKDKIVLVGATHVQLNDNKPSPFGSSTDGEGAEIPGVEVHANALHTLLYDNAYQYFDQYVNLGIMFVLGLLVYFISYNIKPSRAFIVVLIIVVVYIFITISMFQVNTVLEVAMPLFTVFLIYSSTNVYQYLSTAAEKEMIKGAFGQYVSKKVVDELIDNPDLLTLGGDERELSVLFSDVAGFTSISEKLTASELVLLLNEYLTAMTDIVLLNDGIIDKYIGDAIMAEFGAPIPMHDHAIKACHTSLMMLKKLDEMREDFRERKLPDINIRIGVNTGTMVVGNMGSRDVFNYTVMGDNVNLASRLEGANKPYGTRIMISEMTYEHVKSKILCRELDSIKVKGKTLPVKVYEVVGHRDKQKYSSEQMEVWSNYKTALKMYREQDFQTAKNLFLKNIAILPSDGPSKLFAARCEMFIANPPEKDWDGVFEMKTK